MGRLAWTLLLRGGVRVRRSNPLKPEGEWITYIDLKQEGTELQLATQPQYGKCNKVRATR